MISTALAIRDLQSLRKLDPELTVRLLSPGYEVLDITSDVTEVNAKQQQEQEASAFSITKVRIISQALARIMVMVGSFVSIVGRLLVRLLANPYVAGALAVSTVGFGVYKWIKNKLNPTPNSKKVYADKLLLNYKVLLDKHSKYYIICNKGILSGRVVAILEYFGYDVTQVIH